MIITELKSRLKPGCRAHLVGIGGVSMAPLAEVLHGMGVIVSGSDMKESKTVEHLRTLGIQVIIGHFAENVQGKDLVIRTAAVHDDNPEIAAALAAGIPVFERAQAWGALMQDDKNAVCISGTHGKTTTTSKCTHSAMAAQMDPTVMIGGTLPLLHAGHRVGKGDTIILESCEYCNSFLSFRPTTAVILDIEADHLDFFKDLADVENSFRRFADLVPAEGGVIVANADDRNTMDTLDGLDRNIITFGMGSYADVYCENLEYVNGVGQFDLMQDGKKLTHIELSVPGKHNVKNALAAAAAALTVDAPAEAIAAGLHAFRGAERRFQFKGEYHGAMIYDDYAHHPGELHVLMDTVRTLGYERIICAFQPHTYTRTKALFGDFVRELGRPDITLLAEIYAAREKNTLGISSKDLAERIPGAEYCATLDDVKRRLEELAKPGDLILTVGAGDIYTVGEAMVKDAESETQNN